VARHSKHDGAVFKRNDGKILWIRYRDREGNLVRESTFTEDWQEAQRKLRERLQARDDKLLEIVRRGEQLQFSTWVDFFLENYSEPPLRAEKTHEANLRATLHLKNPSALANSLRFRPTTSSFICGAAFRIESGSKSRLVLPCARG